ncbi:MAG: YgaP family membrane protein [Ramlibacter sp.]
MFKSNVGTTDRALRILAGLVLIGLTATQVIGLWGLVGIVPLLTGLAGTCPVYSLLGIRTCPAGKST